MKRQPEQRSRTRQSLDRDLEFDNPKQYRQTLDIRLDLATMDRDQNLATLNRGVDAPDIREQRSAAYFEEMQATLARSNLASHRNRWRIPALGFAGRRLVISRAVRSTCTFHGRARLINARLINALVHSTLQASDRITARVEAQWRRPSHARRASPSVFQGPGNTGQSVP